MIWDGQGYYCDERCIADPDQTRLILLTAGHPDASQFARDLKGQGITHILIDAEGLLYFDDHDPKGHHRGAADYFFEEFAPLCATLINNDKSTLIFEIVCS